MAKPTAKPEFATQDQVDPTSGQNNVVTPPQAWKDYGWSYQEKPPRNYFNWLHRYTYEWIDYLDNVVHRTVAKVVAANNAPAYMKENADYLCDGVDDQVQIQAAIDAVAGDADGVVILSEGTFVVDAGITLADGISIIGAGIGATHINVKDSASATFPVFTISSKNSVRLFGMNMTGGTQSTEGHGGVLIEGSNDVIIEWCRFYEMQYIGGSPTTGRGVTLETSTSTNVQIINCKADSCESWGIYFSSYAERCTVFHCEILSCGASAGGGVFSDGVYNRIVDCFVQGCTTYGIQLDSAAQCAVLGCTVRTTDAGNGIHLSNSSVYCRVSDNHVSDNDYHGIALDGADNNRITDNMVYHNSQDTNDTYDNIRVANSDNNHIAANTCRGGTGNVPKYGLNISDAASNANYVQSNDLAGSHATANINDSGTSTAWNLIGFYVATSSGGSPTHLVVIGDENRI